MKLMTTEQAAKIIYTTAYTVRKYIREGKLAAAKIGKQYLIREADLDRLVDRLTQPLVKGE